MSQNNANQSNAESSRGAREIESDLASGRTRIEYTLELLEERCRPSALADYAWRYARSKSRDGTTTRLQDSVVRNPLPVALMGVGLAWLLLSRRDGSVPRAESPLAEGVTGTPRSSGDAPTDEKAAKDDAKPVAAHSASASPARAGSASANSGPAEDAREPRGNRPTQQATTSANDSSSATADQATTTSSETTRASES